MGKNEEIVTSAIATLRNKHAEAEVVGKAAAHIVKIAQKLDKLENEKSGTAARG